MTAPLRRTRCRIGLLSIAGVALLSLASSAAAVPVTVGGPTAGAEPRWTACTGAGAQPGTECATLTVPMDHASSGGETITLALARLPALDATGRIGSLLLNPGGPGGSGVDAVAYDPTLAGAPEFAALRQRFDIVGFDPRGVGASTPVVCQAPLHDAAVSAFPRTPADFASLARFNETAARGCRAATGPLIDHVDTRSVVEDVEAIREALGEERISWLGLSYGTEIGQLYAQRYPDRVRAMVLDGVVDHGLSARAAAVDQARAIEIALDRFARWCEAGEQCVLRGQDVLGQYDAVIAAAERGEMFADSLGRAVNAEEVTAGAYGLLQLRAAWPRLAEALAAAPRDASYLVAAATFTSPTYPAYRTVGCHDFAPDIGGWFEMTTHAALLRVVAPHTWRYSEFWDWISGCVGWTVQAANPPARLHVQGTPPVLLVSTEFDPATPYRWAERVRRDIEGSVLLTVAGDGHTGILHSSCARTRMTDYLIDGALPPSGTVCPATEDN